MVTQSIWIHPNTQSFEDDFLFDDFTIHLNIEDIELYAAECKEYVDILNLNHIKPHTISIWGRGSAPQSENCAGAVCFFMVQIGR